MENKPGVRIVGVASEENKKKALDEFGANLNRQNETLSKEEKTMLEKFEYPKSEKEIAVIDFANEETSKMMVEAGLEPYSVPIENIRIVPPEIYKKIKGGNENSNAVAFGNRQSIVFKADDFRDNTLFFGLTVFHEMLHAKAHLTIEVGVKGEEVRKTPYREGVGIKALQMHGFGGKWHEHFGGLHEAIVAEAEKKLIPKILDLPLFKKEKSWLTSDYANGLKKELSERRSIPEDEIIWIGDKNKDDWETVSYRQQRRVLNYVCEEIQKEFPDQYADTDSVFKEFLKANFTGQLLPIARLVEKTFGEGSFRILGNMEAQKNSAVLCLETLEKTRARHLRK